MKLKLHKIKYLLTPGLLLILQLASFAQQAKNDSLYALIKNDKEDTIKVNALHGLAWELSSHNPDTAILLEDQALHISEKILINGENLTGWQFGIGKAENSLGFFYSLKGEYMICHSHYVKAMAIWDKLENDVLKDPSEKARHQKTYILNYRSKTLGNIGIAYKKQGDFPRALEYYFKALSIKEALENKKEIAKTLGNIGIVYEEEEDYAKALDYYFKALKISEEIKDPNEIANNNVRIGIALKNQKHFSKALPYYLSALKIYEEAKNKYGIAVALGNIGGLYLEQAEASIRSAEQDSLYSLSLQYYLNSLKLREELGYKYEIAIDLSNIGMLYIKKRKLADAEKYLQRSFDLAGSIGALEITKDVEILYCELDSLSGDYKNALAHYKKYIVARDSITNDENIKKQTQTEMNYEFDKKEAVTKGEQEKKDAVTRIVIYSISSGLFLVLLLAGFIFRSYKQKQKANSIISAQKLEVEKQKELVEEKQKDILDSIHYAKRIQRSLLPTEKYIIRSLERLKKK